MSIVDESSNNSLSQKAGYIVVGISGILVLAILGAVSFHIYMITNPESLYVSNFDSISCSNYECELAKANLMLESDVLFQRTARVQFAVGSRLFISVVAEISALTLIVLGGALVFDRIQGDREALIVSTKTDTNSNQLSLMSSFPGVLLCFFGAITLIFAMWFPTREEAKISVVDLPVFVHDRNYLRNRLDGQLAGINLFDTTQTNTQRAILHPITPDFSGTKKGNSK